MMIFIMWIVFISLEQKANLNRIEKYVENKDFCNSMIPFQDTEKLEINQY